MKLAPELSVFFWCTGISWAIFSGKLTSDGLATGLRFGFLLGFGVIVLLSFVGQGGDEG